MSGRSSMERLHAVHEPVFRPLRGRHCSSGRFFGLDAEEMNPRAQVAAALAVLAPVALSGVLLVALAPGFWWIFTTYFWVVFPAFGLLARGISGLPTHQAEVASARSTGERELLEALLREGEITPVRAAMETSLSVSGADAMLEGLAEAGHLEVRARGGGLFYALWETGSREVSGTTGREVPTRHDQ